MAIFSDFGIRSLILEKAVNRQGRHVNARLAPYKVRHSIGESRFIPGIIDFLGVLGGSNEPDSVARYFLYLRRETLCDIAHISGIICGISYPIYRSAQHRINSLLKRNNQLASLRLVFANRRQIALCAITHGSTWVRAGICGELELL
jgi:hypothetical protein